MEYLCCCRNMCIIHGHVLYNVYMMSEEEISREYIFDIEL